MANNERRQDMSQLNGRLMVVESLLPRIEGYMKEGAELRIKSIERLAALESVCMAVADYQERCDKKREVLAEKVEEIEGKIAWSKGAAAVVAAVFSTIATTIGISMGHK